MIDTKQLNHEVEAELWARNEQCNLLEGAIDVSNNFEISSSVVGQLEADAASTNHLSNILRRVKAYIALRDELADDISSVHNEIERIQAASKRVEIMQTEALPSSIADSKKSLADNEAIVKSMRQSLSDIKSDITKRRAQIEENLVTGALNITKSFSRLEQSQVLVNDKMKDLERKAAAQRLETESVLRELEIARAASSAHVTEADLEKSRMAAVKEGIMMSTKKNEGLLSVFEADNALLQKSLNDSSEAENATAKELEDAKSLLNFLEKFASENNDELHRIRRAQAFEKVREEAFVNSQSGNTGSVQQISNEADRLRASLELVRAEIILRKQQVIYLLNHLVHLTLPNSVNICLYTTHIVMLT